MTNSQKFRHVISLIAVFFFVILAIGSVDNSTSTSSTSSSGTTPLIPSEVTYSIIDSHTVPGIKRSLDVQLNQKVSEDALRAIAINLKSQDPQSYERTFICYTLPHMKVGSGAWATTHFNPDLEVRVLGITVEQEAFLRQLPDDPSQEVVGRWLDENLNRRITFFRQNGKLFIEGFYPDGSNGKIELIESTSNRGKKYKEKRKNKSGDFYFIDEEGNLQLWDEEGYISKAKKMD